MSQKITRFKLAMLKFITFILRYTFGVYLYFSRKPTFKGQEVFKKIKPPYLILANHVTVGDPVLLSYGCPDTIHWVAGNAIFRTRIGRFVMRLFQSISKTKNMSDIETIKLMRNYINKNEVVGLFPEGTQNWDGLTCYIFPSTAKLLKFLKVPVISAVSRGAFLSHPRWAWKRNKTMILVEFNLLFTPEQIKEKTTEDLYEEMVTSLRNDEYEYQKKVLSPIKSNYRAEGIELILYTCPQCQSMEDMTSRGNDIICSSCGFRLEVDQYGFLSFADNSKKVFKTIREWDDWQLSLINDLVARENSGELLKEENVLVKKQRIKGPIRAFASGHMSLTHENLVLESDDTPLVFPLNRIRGANIFKQQQLEFFFEKELYQVNFQHKHSSAYKWLSFIDILGEKNGFKSGS